MNGSANALTDEASHSLDPQPQKIIAKLVNIFPFYNRNLEMNIAIPISQILHWF